VGLTHVQTSLMLFGAHSLLVAPPIPGARVRRTRFSLDGGNRVLDRSNATTSLKSCKLQPAKFRDFAQPSHFNGCALKSAPMRLYNGRR
jgi:hypothetical protein